ncbi:uncharacterized protein spdo [Eurosta solidaginis]|uniref:uncharacterized protein spdo n=1 Tax=Eurosta solidaginis TaxID=178769 RepID=UPI00353118C4
MSHHNYTNPAFCEGSEFYPTRGVEFDPSIHQQPAETIYNRSLNISYGGDGKQANPRVGPLRLQRSMSTRSVNTQRRQRTAPKPEVHSQHLLENQKHLQQQRQYKQTSQQSSVRNVPAVTHARQNNFTAVAELAAFNTRSNSGRYALVPVEDLPSAASKSSRYAIVPGPPAPLTTMRRYAKSQDNLDCYSSDEEPGSFHEEPHSFHGQSADAAFTSLPPALERAAPPITKQLQPLAPKIKHAFSSDFGSKSFLIVDKNSNQRYQMVPTAEDEELVDDNQEIIQMHNGRAHRYAVIPTEEDDRMLDDEDEEEETCLSNPDLNKSETFSTMSVMKTPRNATMRTSTPQKLPMSTPIPNGISSYPGTPLKNPAATKLLHEILSTPRKTPLPRSITPHNVTSLERTPDFQQHYQQDQQRPKYHYRSQQQLHYTSSVGCVKRSAQTLHYDSVKLQGDRTMAVITPRITPYQSRVYPEVEEEDCSSIHGKSTISSTPYPQKVANAAVTLAVVSLMLVISSSMNSALIIYMIAHFGKSFYLQFSLVAAFSGVGLGFLGFRSRHCEWLPNRSYTSGYILVTLFCLLKCCGLVVILVLDPYPGLPLHDVTTGIILGLSTFTIFFIGLGVIGSLWCYRPPPDNRVNVA